MEAPVSSDEGGSTTAAASGHEAIWIDSTAQERAGFTPAPACTGDDLGRTDTSAGDTPGLSAAPINAREIEG